MATLPVLHSVRAERPVVHNGPSNAVAVTSQKHVQSHTRQHFLCNEQQLADHIRSSCAVQLPLRVHVPVIFVKWALLTANGCIVDYLQTGSYTSGWMSYLWSLIVVVGFTSMVVAWQEVVLRRKLAAKCRAASTAAAAAGAAAAQSTSKAVSATSEQRTEPAPATSAASKASVSQQQKACSQQACSGDDAPDDLVYGSSGSKGPASPAAGRRDAAEALAASQDDHADQALQPDEQQLGDAQQQDMLSEPAAEAQQKEQKEQPQLQLHQTLAELGAEFFKRTSLYTPANQYQRMTLSIKVGLLAWPPCCW